MSLANSQFMPLWGSSRLFWCAVVCVRGQVAKPSFSIE
jgi:hypothetical protein